MVFGTKPAALKGPDKSAWGNAPGKQSNENP